MQRRTSNLRYVLPVTLFVLAQVALIAFFVAAASTTVPATKVSASSLNSQLTGAQKQNAPSFARYSGHPNASMYAGNGGNWQISHQSLGQENPAATVTDTLTPSNTPTITLTPCPVGADCTATPTSTFTHTSTHTHTPTSTFTHTPTITLTPCPVGANCTATPTNTPTRTTTPINTTTTTPTTTPICEDQYEPDNSQSQAKNLPPGTDQIHYLCRNRGSKDEDWIKFGATAGKQYTIQTKSLTDATDTLITLYDASGNQLAQNDDYSGGGGASLITYTFATSDIYYLQIMDTKPLDGPGFQYTVTITQQGVVPAPTSNPSATITPGGCYDTYEPDGLPENAKIILIGTAQHPSTQRHSICPSGDADWARFYARAGKVYTVSTSNLGAGVDTFMYVFTSDAKTILAQNDDGGDPANPVASRIDFYPQKDDWYLIQVKNAGDIGGIDQTYDLSLAVLTGVPQPPGTATVAGPPAATVTAGGPSATAARTNTPVPTPTLGAVAPTPTPRLVVLTAPEPRPSSIQQVLPLTNDEIDASSGASNENGTIPNVPLTGADPGVQMSMMSVKNVSAGVTLPQKVRGASAYTSLLLHVFYDRNHDQVFTPIEGIRGLKVYFLNSNAGMMMSGQLVTSSEGTGHAILPVVPQHIFIPYLGLDVPLDQFPEQAEHSLSLPPVNLPDRVP